MSQEDVLHFPPRPSADSPAPEPSALEKTVAKAKAAAEQDPQAFPFSVTVGLVYDGPMDLLLDLIRKQDIDI